MNKVIILFYLFIFGLNINAQTPIENLMNEAKKFNKAYITKDYKMIVKYTIPSVVAIAGGVDEMILLTSTHINTIEKAGMKYTAIIPDTTSMISTEGEDLHAILQQTANLNLENKKVERKLNFLASSNDLGKTWTFLDLEAYDNASLKVFVPSYVGDLKIPTPISKQAPEEK